MINDILKSMQIPRVFQPDDLKQMVFELLEDKVLVETDMEVDKRYMKLKVTFFDPAMEKPIEK